MFCYKDIAAFPINITKPDIIFAKILMTQIGGYAGELGAAIRYFIQAPTMPDEMGKKLLIDIATEELGHIEMLMIMIKCLTKGMTANDFKNAGMEGLYAEHKLGLYPTDVSTVPFNVATLASTGDPIADLQEDMAAEEKARVVYEHLMDLTDNEEILAPLSFLRQREVVHFNRFKELLDYYKNKKRI